MEVFYNNKKIKNNEFLYCNNTKEQPDIIYNFNPNKYYTLIMYDPDAVNGNYIHWLIINIKSIRSEEDGNVILEYKGPSPPPNTGIHHYIFEIYMQDNYIDISNNIFENYNSRIINIEKVKKDLQLYNLIDNIKFRSEYDINNNNGGKGKKRKKSKFQRTISKISYQKCKKRKFSKKAK